MTLTSGKIRCLLLFIAVFPTLGCATTARTQDVVPTDCAVYSKQVVYDRPLYVEKQTDTAEHRKPLAYIRFIEELKGTIKLYEAQVRAFNSTLSQLPDSSAPTPAPEAR